MNQAPKWFTVVAIVALLWNVLGCVAFVLDMRLTPENVAKLSEAQQALYAARPAWSVAATAIAVFGGALGCIGLLIRRRWAFALLLLSLLGIIVQDVELFVLSNGAVLAGVGAVVLQAVVLLVGVLLVLLGRKGVARAWLS